MYQVYAYTHPPTVCTSDTENNTREKSDPGLDFLNLRPGAFDTIKLQHNDRRNSAFFLFPEKSQMSAFFFLLPFLSHYSVTLLRGTIVDRTKYWY